MDNQINKLTEKQKNLIDNLIAINDEQVISLIQEFRINGELYIVQPLIEMLYSKRGQVLKTSILNFIQDIKNQAAVPIISQSIQRHFGDKNSTGLISACWQSNLDFSNELPVFIDILCNGDFQSSFEAFTVIENSIGNLGSKELDNNLLKIKSRLNSISTEKEPLIKEVIVMIENFKQDFFEGN